MTEEMEELVVFTNGVGTVGLPVDTILTVDYGGNNDLGDISVVDSRTLVADTPEDSIATVTYNSKGYIYLVTKSGTDEEHSLFCASVDPIQQDILVNVSRDAVPVDLSPETFQSPLCTEEAVARARGISYLSQHEGDRTFLHVDKVWVGANFLDINTNVFFDGKWYQITSINITYDFPELKYTVSLFEIGYVD